MAMNDYETRRAKYRRVLAASSLPEEDKARLMQTAQYMADRLRNIPARPPAHWTAEQIAAFAAVLADPQARAAAISWALEGLRELDAEAAALPD
jgi:hypothetical protein